MSIDWLAKLKQYAPDIAAAVMSGGATLPALAMKAIADATGSPVSSVEQLGGVVENADPEVMLRVTQANNAFKVRMAELGNELTATELADVQNARAEHKHSRVPAVLVFMLTTMVCAGLGLLLTVTIPPENEKLAYLVFGQVLTGWIGALAYWNGTTRSSANKDARRQ